ncbi:MAG: hypothetical protein COU10_02180 [Candidatus Harrisonbacteria bacterium CG10_big_fil_rev_8_21_14_0_10_45_28]|uniref:Uncharacterized protein n=1 Tax=Candidatus Harrisonbacteria bacterium CG10_big_fil_rev_8_21_14_0_10_45_28 TaxID=1974586 RepID=A0A2H0UNA3_9BACT|nr:MAG: hypothetical protein COU10_02180 [Candidatus Harrisonbacteria bacterium CG10_big_fil_rev_8_21_14_0_10_45_28]
MNKPPIFEEGACSLIFLRDELVFWRTHPSLAPYGPGPFLVLGVRLRRIFGHKWARQCTCHLKREKDALQRHGHGERCELVTPVLNDVSVDHGHQVCLECINTKRIIGWISADHVMRAEKQFRVVFCLR